MIEDRELREIFKDESAEHIQRLEEGFLRLEREPQNQAVLEEVFREAHSLKGASRIIGLSGVEVLSHHLEDVLGAARKGAVSISSEIIDRLCNGLDAIRGLVREAVTGEPSGVKVSKILEQLALKQSTASGTLHPEQHDITSELDTTRPAPAEPFKNSRNHGMDKDGSAVRTPDEALETEPPSRPSDVKEVTLSDFTLDTIRVETNRLDKLLSQAGELNVTKLRISQRFEDIKNALALWEEAGKISTESGIRNSELKKDNAAFVQLGESLGCLKRDISTDSARLDFASSELEKSISRIRLLPVSTIFNLFQRMVRDLAKDKSKEIQLVIKGGETVADKRIIEEMKDPLMHMVRNAVDHGIELPDDRELKNKPRSATITIRAYQTPANVIIEIHDDGRGLDIEAIKRAAMKGKIASESELAAMSPAQIHALIFVSGISTSAFISDVSGRGVGLDVVRTNVERLKGALEVASEPDRGCTIKVKLPLTLATSRVILVMANRMKLAFPLEQIETTHLVHRQDIFSIEGRRAIIFNKTPVSVFFLTELLELKVETQRSAPRSPHSDVLPCIILSTGEERVGLFVDELLDEQEIVLKQYSALLKRVRNISGATILGTGEVCMVLNPFDLIKSAKMKRVQVDAATAGMSAETKKSVLVAEDSMTVRTQIKRIIEGAGYEVVVAVDGVDAFKKLSGRSFDALVSDINMPNMNGLTLTEKVRQNKKFKDMPVILVTSLASDDDRQKGLEAGANAYMAKPSFDQKVFLETLGRLV